jgi:hypothetical protein
MPGISRSEVGSELNSTSGWGMGREASSPLRTSMSALFQRLVRIDAESHPTPPHPTPRRQRNSGFVSSPHSSGSCRRRDACDLMARAGAAGDLGAAGSEGARPMPSARQRWGNQDAYRLEVQTLIE